MKAFTGTQLFDFPTPTAVPGTYVIKVHRSYAYLLPKTASQSPNAQSPDGIGRFAHLVRVGVNALQVDGVAPTYRRWKRRNKELRLSGIPFLVSITGEVAQVGAGNARFQINDRVAAILMSALPGSEFYLVAEQMCFPLLGDVGKVDPEAVIWGAAVQAALKEIDRHGSAIREFGVAGKSGRTTIIQNVAKELGWKCRGVVDGLRLSVTSSTLPKAEEKLPCLSLEMPTVPNGAVYTTPLLSYGFIRDHTSSDATNHFELLGSLHFPDPRVAVMHPHYKGEFSAPEWMCRENLAQSTSLASRLSGDFAEKYISLHDAMQLKQSVDPKNTRLPWQIAYKSMTEDTATSRSMRNSSVHPIATGALGVSAIGAGGHMMSSLLPAFEREKGVVLRGVMDIESERAYSAREAFSFDFCSTNPDSVWDDDRTDCVAIATFASAHFGLVTEALQAGKKVFVEKPVVTTFEELIELVHTISQTKGVVWVGFNRPFAPAFKDIVSSLQKTKGPTTISCEYRIYDVEASSWYRWPQNRGRVVTNACHWLDMCCRLVNNARPIRVSTVGSPVGVTSENASITVTFDDGSIANITLSNRGAQHYLGGHELIMIQRENMSIRLDDFSLLECEVTTGLHRRKRFPRDKGHAAGVRAFLQYVQSAQTSNEILANFIISSALTLYAQESLEASKPVDIDWPGYIGPLLEKVSRL